MRVYGASRRELFERLDKPALGPLAAERFVTSEWKTAQINIDYHIEFDHHSRSRPSTIRSEAICSSLERVMTEGFVRQEGARLRLAALVSRGVVGGVASGAQYQSRAEGPTIAFCPFCGATLSAP